MRIERTTFFKSVRLLREVVGPLKRDEFPGVRKNNVPYFRDICDHTVSIIETVETNRDIISSMLDIYRSSMSNRINCPVASSGVLTTKVTESTAASRGV